MSHRWQYVPLRELLNRSEERVTINPEETYREITIKLWGKGVTSRREVVGAEIAAGIRFIARKQQFILSRIDARNGAFGLVPDSLDGAVVTNDFPVFNLNTERLLPRYLELFGGLVVSTEFPVFEVDETRVLPEVLDVYFRSPSVWPALSGESTGTNVRRRRLNPSNFLNFKMPLPPMNVQPRLRQVKAKVDALKLLQAETAAEINALLPSILDKAFKGEL